MLATTPSVPRMPPKHSHVALHCWRLPACRRCLQLLLSQPPADIAAMLRSAALAGEHALPPPT
jgi:hypothetical protein